MFENGGQIEGLMPKDGYTISSPGELHYSGELKMSCVKRKPVFMVSNQVRQKLDCVFVFADAKSRFSHDVAQMFIQNLVKDIQILLSMSFSEFHTAKRWKLNLENYLAIRCSTTNCYGS